MTEIKVFHTKDIKGGNPFMFTCVDMLAKTGRHLPSKEDLDEYYVKVLDMQIQDEVDPRELCNQVYHQINCGIGCFDRMVSQYQIAQMKTHTSTSVGDIIQINDTLYYVDYIGFEPFKLESYVNH